MTTVSRRSGALIDPTRTLTVTVDGRDLPAHPGDTLASALLANGVAAVGTSPTSGRPRGIDGVGRAGASGYVQVESGSGEPMVPATAIEVHPGLRARTLSGYGRIPDTPATDRCDAVWTHCEVLVVGAGPAGLAAARAAAATGARVVLASAATEPGGGLRHAPRTVAGTPGLEWTRQALAELRAHPDVRVLTHTTVTGLYPHGEAVALQRDPAPRAGTDPTRPAATPPTRHRLWHIRARRVVLATGAAERPIAFAGNDRPGVMTTGAAVGYAWAYGALPGRRAVVLAATDDALRAAVDLADAGVRVAAVLDPRPHPPATAGVDLSARDIPLWPGHAVTATRAETDGRLAGVRVAPVDTTGRATGPTHDLDCDLLAVCGGFDPELALLGHLDGRVHWSPGHAAFVPDDTALPDGLSYAGAAGGTRDADTAAAEGAETGHTAARVALAAPSAGPAAPEGAPTRDPAPDHAAPATLWLVTGPDAAEDEVFVDPHRDVTLADLRAALDAGLTNAEHIKRYTSLGTGPEQARARAVLARGVLAQLRGIAVAEVGAPRRRPPLEPIPFAALAGRNRGDLLDPVRRTPMHDWHVAHGAVFEDVGQWRRARYYPRRAPDGVPEDMTAAVRRECHAAREGVAVLDASTLGKIVVEGRDAATFLDRVYATSLGRLAVGRCRYAVLLGADGMVLDDGVVVRLAPHRFLVTTTSGNAETVLAHLDEWSQTEWPELVVHCTPVTEHWATVSVVGPRSRDVVAALAPDLDPDPAAFPFMRAREATVAGVPALVLRVSFTGELTYEIYVCSWYGRAVWDAVLEAGAPHGITPYGTETMHVLRAEKGFIVVGHETDGQVSPVDAGLGWALAHGTGFVGERSLARADTARADRPCLVGLLPLEPDTALAEGAQLIAEPAGTPPVPILGRITSAYPSATLGGTFGLGLLEHGAHRHGEVLYAYHLGASVPVRVTDPVFYDREGTRRDG